MLPFLGKEETNLRRLESQLQQKECQISNVEASLVKAKTEIDKFKVEADKLRIALRESTTRNIQQEQQIERYNKELKSKKEMGTWLQEQVTYLKKELETKTVKEKDVANTVHHKTEETDRLRMELQGLRREVDHLKSTMQTSDIHFARFRNEAQAEIERLKNELLTKVQALKLMEATLEERELTEEQNAVLRKATGYEQVVATLEKTQIELRSAQTNAKELEDKLKHAEFMMREFHQTKEQNANLVEECQRLGNALDVCRKENKRTDDLEAERTRLSAAFKQLEKRCEQQELDHQQLTRKAEAGEMMKEAFEASAVKTTAQLQEKNQELSGIQAQCLRLTEENNKLYEHITYTQEQLEKAKDAIDAKQGILDAERAISSDEKQNQRCLGKLVQDLRSELETSRRQIAELTTKDKKAKDAIQALERRIEIIQSEASQFQAHNQFLDKELKTAQADVLRVQKESNAVTDRMTMYKSRLDKMRAEMAGTEKHKLADGGPNRLPKCPEYYVLKERVLMLEEEIAAERHSHNVTKTMLKQECQHKESQNAQTHVSTPFPFQGANFRFSYCRPDQPQSENLTPIATNTTQQLSRKDMPTAADPNGRPTEIADTADQMAEKQNRALSLTPVNECDGRPDNDDGAMDIDDVVTQKPNIRFFTPGPHPLRHRRLDDATECFIPIDERRRATLDPHHLSVYASHEDSKKDIDK